MKTKWLDTNFETFVFLFKTRTKKWNFFNVNFNFFAATAPYRKMTVTFAYTVEN